MIESESSPLFSVVIPTYNRRKPLERAVRSVLEQSLGDFELLIVDDNSSDDTCSWLASQADDRIKVLSNKRRKGAPGARNTGIATSRAPWVAFLDSDDWWDANKLWETREAIQNNPSVRFFYTEGRYVGSNVEQAKDAPLSHSVNCRKHLGRLNPIVLPSVVVRRSLLTAVGGFDESLPARQDIDLYWRLTPLTAFLCVPNTCVTISQEETNRISLRTENRLEGWQMFYKKHRKSLCMADRLYQQKRIVYYAWVTRNYRVALRYLPGAVLSYVVK